MSVDVSTGGVWKWILSIGALGVPAFVLRFSDFHIISPVTAIIFGVAIVAGAFLLSWAAEVAQMDVSASLAIAVLALIAILPEYAIEFVLAWDAGIAFDDVSGAIDPVTGQLKREIGLVAANVTGANRLLIGLGWSAVILIFWSKRRQSLDLRGQLSFELIVLAVATLLLLPIFFMKEVHVILGAVLIAIYLFYLWTVSRRPPEHPELVGPASIIGALPVVWRRVTVILLFVYAALVIIVAAEPFVESLIATGEKLGISEFLLIQWLAPLASESPEIIVAVLFCLRSNPSAGLTTLISAEVSQLTLLVGSMVFVFSISSGGLNNFPLDSRQATEFLLTFAMSFFAIVLISRRLISWRVGAILIGFFVIHLFFTSTNSRLVFSYVFIGLALITTILNWRKVKHLLN